jgi:DNA polymerase-1
VTRTLLIDGDIDAYQIASRCETKVDWGDGVESTSADSEEAKQQIDERYRALKKMLGADRLIVCLSDSQNFRKAILPTYKANRKNVIKPALLSELRKYLHESYEVFQRPLLEADDVMGILSTMGDNDLIHGERIIVSIDKDMKNVPGLLFNPGRPMDGTVEISEGQADYSHLMQTLTGDPTDGYGGCPGVGKAKAKKILTKTDANDPRTLWDFVLGAFAHASGRKLLPEGETFEAYALKQAQVAKILTAEWYDFTNKRPIPWMPTRKKEAA